MASRNRAARAARMEAMAAMGVCAALSPLALAAPWLPPGDLTVRHDIELLADAGVIRSPVMTWPISWPDVARDAMAVELEDADPQIRASLMRIQRQARKAANVSFSGWAVRAEAAREPTRLRTFSDTPREDGGLSLEASWLGGRWAVNLDASIVGDPSDDQRLRLDGSYVGLTVGNYMISAGSIDRWWGPGWEGSLILSTNARPIPGIAIERNYSDPFRWRPLSWLGPWRASVSMGRMEGGDVAVPDARFFAARIDFRPRPWLEFALSRTAQWCGEGRPCDLGTFGDLLAGRDNRDESLTVTEEPGNQMAGYDVRVRSPWKRLPAAFYTQLIGEDEAGGLPSRLLGLMGLETWGESAWGSLRLHAEYADTACNFSRRSPLFGCAYRNQLYPEGYSYRGRAIGHSLDGDGRMHSFGALLVRPDGSAWSLLAREARINRDNGGPGDPGDPAHTVSVVRDTVKNVELQYNRAFAWGEWGVGLGVDDHDQPARDGRSDLRGFVTWRQGFE